MKIRSLGLIQPLAAGALILLSLGEVSALDICSTEGQPVLKKLNVDAAKLKEYCGKVTSTVSPASPLSYDLISGKNDVAEVLDDLANGKAIGKKISFRLAAKWTEQYCSMNEPTGDGRQTLYCDSDLGSAHFYIYCKSKDRRVELLKNRPHTDLLNLTGTIIDNFAGNPVVEIQ